MIGAGAGRLTVKVVQLETGTRAGINTGTGTGRKTIEGVVDGG